VTISLKKIAGLPIKLTKNKINFNGDFCQPDFEVKKYADYKKFFKNDGLDKNKNLYYIYRNCCLKKDKKLFSKASLRYDITLIPAGLIGNEPHRTIGHIHKKLDKKNVWEIYQVIYGKAIFLIQNKKTKKVYAVYRNKGQKIIIPPDWGHITINALVKKPLVVSNIFANRKNLSDYSFFKKTHGPAWYPVWKENGIVFEKNRFEKSHFDFKEIKKYQDLPFGILKTKPLYKEFIQDPDKFSFLISSKKSTRKFKLVF
jgi:glucose-6-phosphate isomerase